MSDDTALADAAKRISDAYRLHQLADKSMNIGKWIAPKLSDGTGGNQLYDSRRDAIRHAADERYVFPIQIGPWDLSPKEAAHILVAARKTFDAGLRFADPDHHAGGLTPIPRLTAEDQRAQLLTIAHGRPSRNLLIGPNN